MKITKGKVILALIIIYFAVFAVINVNKEKEINKDILNKVIFVTDGKIDKKNEGKLVVVSGKISYDEPVTFIELEDFKTIKAKRKVEDYIKVEEDGKTKLEWVERKEPLENNDGDFLKVLTTEEKIANVKVGEYTLDSHGLELIPADRRYSKQEKVGDLITTGLDYSRDPYEEDLKEGDMRITYTYYELEKYPNMSILAVQKGDSFIPYEYDKKNEVYQLFVGKIENKEQLSKQLKLNVKKTVKGKTLFIIMILGVGVFLIVDNRKK